ncbi:MAG: hypothetical protein GY854_18590 [Deltaproteobacteria bacterium]|nr:hypothetical protein [Deltaproteobacteria bacterium]
MRKKTSMIAALILGLGIVVYFTVRENETTDGDKDDRVADNKPGAVSDTQASMRDSQKKDRAIRLNKALKAMELQHQRQQAHRAKERDEESSDADRGTMADKFNESFKKHSLKTLEAELVSGIKDEQWREEVVSHLNDLFEKMKSRGTNVESVDCTTKMCGVTLRHKDHAAFQEFGSSKDFAGPWDKGERFATFSMVKDNLSIRFFFSKEGRRLPSAKEHRAHSGIKL